MGLGVVQIRRILKSTVARDPWVPDPTKQPACRSVILWCFCLRGKVLSRILCSRAKSPLKMIQPGCFVAIPARRAALPWREAEGGQLRVNPSYTTGENDIVFVKIGSNELLLLDYTYHIHINIL